MLVVVAIAMGVTLLTLPPFISLSRTTHLLAIPDARRLHGTEMPQIGGLAIFTGFVVGLAMTGQVVVLLWPYLIAAALLLMVGLYDDFRELSPWVKLAAQVLAAVVVLNAFDLLQHQSASFGGGWQWLLPIAGLVYLVGVTNAVNLSDGLDGLAAGLALLSALALAVLAFGGESLICLAILFPLIGGLFGFLRFNAHPARVFMGDHGAYFVGFSLGFCALIIAPATINPLAALLILGAPIYDTLSVAIRRVSQGRHPFSPDRQHLHHRFLALGISHDSTVLCVYLIHAVLIVLGFLFRQASIWETLGVLLLAYGLLELVLSALAAKPRNLEGFVSLKRHLAATKTGVTLVSRWLILLGPFAALLLTPVPSADFVLIAALFLGGLGLRRWYAGDAGGWTGFDRVLLYVAGSYAVYFLAVDSGASLDVLENLYFGLLGALIVLRLLGAPDNFRFTALDGLVLLGAIALSTFGQWQLEDYGLEIIKLVIWFYAVEVFVLAQNPPAWRDLIVGAAYFVILFRFVSG